ncbi:chitinase-3-like protein 2 [Asbolus verrucosus]|uniref:Chitinase-3-like protein 2 n=1 Tax=Asbolus verrucosus TaxID=1661398 RepID=A0A482VKS8_ASBVE|nr:chitinase-3-like protein 2 [Asbolus verrucosus]
MTDVYSGHSQFILLTDNRRRWFDGRTVFLITVISLPIIVFCGIYTIILKNNESLLYPKSYGKVPSLWTNRAKIYTNHPKTYPKNNEIHLFGAKTFNQIDDFKLVCYYNFPTDDFNTLQPKNIDPFLCTHINVGFANVYNNTLTLDVSQLEILKSVVGLKKINNKLKILISVGGAGNDTGFAEMVLNHATRKLFIKSVLEHVKIYDVDGVDLDWEFPNQEPHHDKYQRMHFTQLLEEFRATINKQTRHKFMVTIAAAAPPFLVDNCYDVSYINQFVDFISVMSYDYHFYSKITPFTGLNSPLFQSSQDKGYFTNLNINYTTHYWILKGMSRDKIIIGLPTYGHTFRLTNNHNNGLYAPARGYGRLGSDGFVDYTQTCKFLSMNQISPVFDMEARSPYATKASEWISFENEQSLSFKAEYVRDQQLGGAMIYSLNTDDHMGACKIDPNIHNEPFPLTKKVREILDRNYSLF